YTYSAKNKLLAVTKAGETTSFGYNPDGIRTRKAGSGATTDFIVDQNRDYAQVLQEVVNGAKQVSYVYGDDLLSQARASDVSYYVYDGQGSVRSLTNQIGVQTDSYHYDAFGILLHSEGDTPNSYLYTGEQYDASLDQYYLRARYYDQNQGRFTQMDTWMGHTHDPVTLHKYIYADADPATGIDPSGYMTLGEVGASFNIASNLATTSLRVWSVVEKVDTVLNLIGVAREVQSMLSSGKLSAGIKDNLKSASKSMGSVNIDDAVDSLIRMTPSVTISAIAAWSGFLSNNAGKIDRFVIYLPQTPNTLPIEIPFAKSGKYKINFVMDNKGDGRLAGVGIGLKGSKRPHQIWRMDSHKPHAGKNPDKDAFYAIDRQFHYHVNRAPAK
ncbi:RHS repeat-associated core domain-containing protein, partial [Hahella sp. HN01]|uniref:RHS repeat-associated core domain-containing protein n=1 Tax=Hahella sp. HN01 TaxID=2847262 RepID=UPI0020A65F19